MVTYTGNTPPNAHPPRRHTDTVATIPLENAKDADPLRVECVDTLFTGIPHKVHNSFSHPVMYSGEEFPTFIFVDV